MAIIGGGAKKVLYTLATARRIGLLDSAKALNANNTCKACGLGMGGQRGGMTNELDEYPSVCNKSLQAQSTDIQPPIPAEIFDHPLSELRDLRAYDLEHLGRLGKPIFKAADSDRYTEVDWDWALARAAEKFNAADPDKTFFYSSGRSSNEAGFVLQLMARLYGTNNISNCSYYCHQATGVALESTVGTGTATVELADLGGCDLVFLIGANPASNHPRLLHKLIKLRRRGGRVVVINPLKEAGLVKFAAPRMASSMLKGGDEVASHYLQPRIGSDIALFKGIAKAVLEAGAEDAAFISTHTANFAELRSALAVETWQAIEHSCGIARETIFEIARVYAASKNTVFAWGMGMTHHRHGVDNIEWISNLALLRGMIGRPHAGLLPLRGHSNVQGIGTIGVKPVLPAQVFSNIEAAYQVKLPQTAGLHTLASLERAHAGGIEAALMMGGNLFSATPDSGWTATAFSRIPFKLFLTTTLNAGHLHGNDASESLILPVCARDEEPQPTTQESMFNYVRMSDGGIERIASVRSEVSILADLAGAIAGAGGFDFSAFKKHGNVRKAIAAVIPGMEALADIDVAKREFYVAGRLRHTPEFKTGDGKARFALPEAAVTAQPEFMLMTIRSEGQFNSIIYEEADSYRGVDSRWTVLMNRQDALERGINEGDAVDLATETGAMPAVKVRIFDIPQGNLAVYYPEANVLTGRGSDHRSHTPAFKSVPVALSITL